MQHSPALMAQRFAQGADSAVARIDEDQGVGICGEVHSIGMMVVLNLIHDQYPIALLRQS